MCDYNLTVYAPNSLSLLYLAPFGPWSTYQSTYLYLSCSNLFNRWFSCGVCGGLCSFPGASLGLGRGFRSWSWRVWEKERWPVLVLFAEVPRCHSQTSYQDHYRPDYKCLVGSVGYNTCHMLSNQYLMHRCSTLIDCSYFCWAAITTLGSMLAYALKLTLLV